MSKLENLLHTQRDFFRTGKTRPLAFRTHYLEKLREVLIARETSIMGALKEDLGKSNFDAYLTEIGVILSEIRFILKNIHRWAKPKKVPSPLFTFGQKGFLYPEPFGVSLILSPWNYPFQLALAPLLGSLSAGNCTILKPSEFSPKTSGLLQQLLDETFPEELACVVTGGIKESQMLLNQRFDYIFFTGSVAVGRRVMEAAAKHLTPLTLELGGKSPCIVHKDANLPLAAKRIAWGKFLNAGQTCVAPDYLYVHEEIYEPFLQELAKSIATLFGENPLDNDNYPRIVSEKHFLRLCSYLKGSIHFGGHVRQKDYKIAPTLLTDVSWKDDLMQEEIFGPLLPILAYAKLEELLEGVICHSHPLALYLFTEDKKVEERILQSISFGGGCVNDTILHLAHPFLPFGGVGTSGMGSYHGKATFDTFTHYKSVLKQTTKFDLPLRYPNGKGNLARVRRLLR